MAIPVEDKPLARLLITPKVGGSAIGKIRIDGNAASGSKHIIDLASATLSDASTEMVRVDFDSIDAAKELFLSLVLGQASHAHYVRYTMSTAGTVDDIAAAQRLLDGYPDVPLWLTSTQERSLRADTSMVSVYVLGIMAPGATITSCVSDLQIGARSYA